MRKAGRSAGCDRKPATLPRRTPKRRRRSRSSEIFGTPRAGLAGTPKLVRGRRGGQATTNHRALVLAKQIVGTPTFDVCACAAVCLAFCYQARLVTERCVERGAVFTQHLDATSRAAAGGPLRQCLELH